MQCCLLKRPGYSCTSGVMDLESTTIFNLVLHSSSHDNEAGRPETPSQLDHSSSRPVKIYSFSQFRSNHRSYPPGEEEHQSTSILKKGGLPEGTTELKISYKRRKNHTIDFHLQSQSSFLSIHSLTHSFLPAYNITPAILPSVSQSIPPFLHTSTHLVTSAKLFIQSA